MAILTFFLLGALYIAIGMFISSLCDNQMVAFVCTFLVLLVFYLWDTVIGIIPASSAASLIGLIILFAVGAFIIYHFTKSLYISGGIFFAAWRSLRGCLCPYAGKLRKFACKGFGFFFTRIGDE